MTKPRLGFKIWIRNFRNNLQKKIHYFFQKSAGAFFGGIVGVLGIWLAYKANKFSETALALAQNDSSQQLQIDRLRDILIETKIQSGIAKSQTKELISVVSETNKINMSTNSLIAGSKKQTELLYQQLLLSKKTDSLSNLESSFASQGDLLTLKKIFEEIRDINMTIKVMSLYLDPSPDINTLTDLRVKFEKGLTNKIFLTDSIIKIIWYSYYLELKDAEDNVKIFNAQGKPSDKFPKMKEIGKTIRDHYFEHINLLWKRLDDLELIFKKSILRKR